MSAAGDISPLADVIASLSGLPAEQVRCYRIDADRRRLVAVEAERLSEQWPGTCDEVWIDIQAAHPDEFRAPLEKLDLHPLILEDCLIRTQDRIEIMNQVCLDVPTQVDG